MQSQQIHLFNEAQPGPTAYQTSAKQAARRVFLYDGQQFEDPGPEYTIQDVLEALAQTYPALANGTWTSRTLPDSTEEITFVKVTGEKGNQADFFDGAENADPPQLPGPTAQKPTKRVFLYDGQVFEDPGPDACVQPRMC